MKFLPKGKYVWGDWKMLHEQGKVTRNIFPVILETYQGMHKIRPLPESDFDRKLEPEKYPDFWINPSDLVEESNIPTPTPTPSISDSQAGIMFVMLVKWIVSLFK